MNFTKDDLTLLTFRLMGYEGSEDFIQNFIFRSIVEAFANIKADSNLEEKIRDTLVYYLKKQNEEIKELIEQKVLYLDSERRQDISETEKRRTDISFSMSGFEFVFECKTLKFASKKYLEEGLQRFIDLKYAENDDFAGMLGFIIKGKPENIVKNLKKKVKDFYPAQGIEKLLQKKCLEQALSFQSKHLRSNNTEIHVFHLFFDLREEV